MIYYYEESKSYQPVNIGNSGNANKTITAKIKCKKLLGSENSSSCDIVKNPNISKTLILPEHKLYLYKIDLNQYIIFVPCFLLGIKKPHKSIINDREVLTNNMPLLFFINIARNFYCETSTFTSMSSAILELLNIAETVNTKTANITVVNLKPREDDLFIIFPASLSIFLKDKICS